MREKKKKKKCIFFFFFQAEDGIRDLVRSRGLGDMYKRQCVYMGVCGGARMCVRVRGCARVYIYIYIYKYRLSLTHI